MIKKVLPALILLASSASASPKFDVQNTETQRLSLAVDDCRVIRCVEFEPCPCRLPGLPQTPADRDLSVRLTLPDLLELLR